MTTHLRRAAEAADARALDELIDAAAVRRLCGSVSDMTIRRWCARGILPKPRHIERRRYWRRGDVIAALDAHREPAPDGPAARTRRADAP